MLQSIKNALEKLNLKDTKKVQSRSEKEYIKKWQRIIINKRQQNFKNISQF